jgi:ribokinase
MKILNFGSLNIDYVYCVDHLVQPGETETSENLQVICGGKGLNQSIALARAGASVFHAGNIGMSDGSILKEKLSSFGVDVELIQEHDCKSGHAVIQVDKGGQNCIMLYGGANHKVTRAQADIVLSDLADGDMILLQNEINMLDYIIKEAYRRNIKIALNPSPMNENILKLPLNRIAYLFINEIEASVILGTDKKDWIKHMADQFPNCIIVLTLGASGVEVMCNGQYYQHDAYAVEAVDTTAAGDTFTGFFLATHTKGYSMEMCLELASKAAAICVTKKGASDSIPSMEEVLNMNFLL